MIVTFYSYKGGVGRSMALANVADILAREGLRVLMIDFDLEAPGLEQFFAIDRAKAIRHLGLLDLLASYKQAMARDPHDAPTDGDTPAFKRLRELFILPVYPDLPSRGRLDLLPAGRRGSEDEMSRYALELRTFDWQDFYFKWGGELFFEWLRRALVPELYDVVLVDSRTGVTEMGGICAYQLADAVIMLCAANRQNVDGILSVVRNFSSPRVLDLRRGRPPQIVVVPSRIENSNDKLLEDFRDRFIQAFNVHTPDALVAADVSFWDLLIPYDPLYAFAEQVIADPARGATQRRAAKPYRRLVEAIGLLAEPDNKLHQLGRDAAAKSLGHAALDVSFEAPQYDITRQTAAYDVFLSHATADRSVATAITSRLLDAGLRIFTAQQSLTPGMNGWQVIKEAIKNSRALLVLIGSNGLSISQDDELRFAFEAHAHRADFHFIPVLLPEAPMTARERLPRWLRQLSWIDLRAGLEDPEALELLVAAIRGQRSEPAQAASQMVETPPYPGLTPFSEEDAAYFFGRAALVETMLQSLGDRRCLFVVGPSGCGKSSLVLAGLVPALRRGAVSGSESWRFLVLRPGARPVLRLANGLAELDNGDQPLEPASVPPPARARDGEADHAELEAALLHDPNALLERVSEGGFSSPDRRLVLIVDQFEEIWTVGRELEEGEAFCRQLATAAVDPDSPLILVITLRADFTHRALALRDFASLLNQHLVLVPPMSRAELRAAIEEPARRAGLAFEPGLIETILSDIGDAPGALPLLQSLLFRLWEGRQNGFLTHLVYQRTGGVHGALAQRAEEVYVAQDDAEQEVARSILLRLVQPGSDGAPDTRRRASFGELFTSQSSSEAVERVIEQLNAARLVIVSQDARGAALELAHDALIEYWPRLHAWIDEERDWLRQRRRLALLAQEWGGRDEGLLLRGALLHELAEASRGHSLSVLEKQFLDASLVHEAKVERQESESRRHRTLATAAFLVATLTFTVLSVVWKNRTERTVERAAQQATSVFSPNRRLLVFAREDQLGILQLFPSVTSEVTVEMPALVTIVGFSPDSRLLAAGSSDGSLTVLNARKGREGYRLLAARAHSTPVRILTFSSDSSSLATTSDDGNTKIWDLATIEQGLRGEVQPAFELSLANLPITTAFSADGNQLLTTSDDQRTTVCNFESDQCVHLDLAVNANTQR